MQKVLGTVSQSSKALEKARASLMDWDPGNYGSAIAHSSSVPWNKSWGKISVNEQDCTREITCMYHLSSQEMIQQTPEHLLICQVFSMRECSPVVPCTCYITVINNKRIRDLAWSKEEKAVHPEWAGQEYWIQILQISHFTTEEFCGSLPPEPEKPQLTQFFSLLSWLVVWWQIF